ncbi:MAG: nuclease-related domain-containing protein [Bacillota bacterium]|nr:nuclease-related domain-containing protein [Bacillota bacterium]
MGQLIKLQDYISRYEQDIFSYPSRFVRLKQQQWTRTKENWETEGVDASNLSFQNQGFEQSDEKEKQPFFAKMKDLLKFNTRVEDVWEVEAETKALEMDDDSLQFSAAFHVKPAEINDLKQQFLDQLFRFQLKWASTTLFEKSNLHSKFYFDDKLKFFLQRFPDTFLTLYRPIFLLKKAPVEAEIILLTPTDAWCISFLEEENDSVFIGSSERFWLKRLKNDESKFLNPVIALNRTEKIVRKIFQLHEIDLPIHKLILSRNGYIDFPSPPFDVKFVEMRNFDGWFQSMRSLKSPLKHIQLKAAQVLLQYCQTASMRRHEWEKPEQDN